MFENNNELAVTLFFLIDQIELQLLKMEQKPNTPVESNVAFLYQLLNDELFLDEYGLVGDSIPSENPEQDLLDLIQVMLNATRDQILTGTLAFINTIDNEVQEIDYSYFNDLEIQIGQLGLDILGLFTGLQSFIDFKLSEIVSELKQDEFQTRSIIVGSILQSEGILLDSMLNTQNNLSSLIQQDIQQTTNLMGQVENSISNKIMGSTMQLQKDISKLGVKIDNIESGSVNNSAWTEAYIVDLLGVLSDGFNWLRQLELSPEIINNITVDSDGVDSGSNEDVSAGIGFNFDLLTPQLVKDFFSSLVTDTLDNSLADANIGLNILMKAGRGEYSDIQDLWNDLNSGGFTSGLINLIWQLVAGVTLVGGMGLSASQPYRNNLETLARTDALDGLVPLPTLLELQVRRLVGLDKIFEGYRKLGLDDEKIGMLLQATTIQFPEPYLREAYLREEIDYDNWSMGMTKLGYREEDLPLLEKVIKNTPSIQDAVLFAVREVYDETLVNDLKLDSGYDSIKDEFEPLLQANGIDPKFAKYYWRSHWRLPSPTQLYEMYWRNEIDQTELREALQVSDYSPQWIDKLENIAYKEFTRVDVRRMHDIGELTDDETKEAYKRIGYNDDKAEKLLRFTQKLNKKEEGDSLKSFTTSQILKLYGLGLYDLTQAKDSLSSIGYSNNQSNMLLDVANISYHADVLGNVTDDNIRRIIRSLSQSYIEGVLPEDYVKETFLRIGYTQDNVDKEIEFLNIERDIQLRNETNDIILNQYLKYQLTINEASVLLNQQGYNSVELSNIMTLWNKVREDRKKLPTKAEARSFLEEGKITDSEYRDILRGSGVMEKYINLY